MITTTGILHSFLPSYLRHWEDLLQSHLPTELENIHLLMVDFFFSCWLLMNTCQPWHSAQTDGFSSLAPSLRHDKQLIRPVSASFINGKEYFSDQSEVLLCLFSSVGRRKKIEESLLQQKRSIKERRINMIRGILEAVEGNRIRS